VAVEKYCSLSSLRMRDMPQSSQRRSSWTSEQSSQAKNGLRLSLRMLRADLAGNARFNWTIFLLRPLLEFTHPLRRENSGHKAAFPVSSLWAPCRWVPASQRAHDSLRPAAASQGSWARSRMATEPSNASVAQRSTYGRHRRTDNFEVFKARLDEALGNLGWWKLSLLMAGGLEPDDL